MKIYLAGKMTGWRYPIVKGLESAECSILHAREQGGAIKWPELPCSILDEHDYVGPFRASCTHGGPAQHGINGCCNVYGLDGAGPHDAPDFAKDREQIKQCCLAAIDQSDMVFANVTDASNAFGTIFELGYAEAKGKPIVIYNQNCTHDTDWEDYTWNLDIWLALECVAASPNRYAFGATPLEALQRFLEANRLWVEVRKHGTPIEKMFLDAWATGGYSHQLEFQHKIGKYSVDFAHVPTKTVIELDGLVGHSTPTDIEKDRVRQRWIERQGWSCIRFGGREVFLAASALVQEVADFIRSRESA